MLLAIPLRQRPSASPSNSVPIFKQDKMPSAGRAKVGGDKHQAKKQFQPQSQITNFFSSTTSYGFDSQFKEELRFDEQDEDVQFSLLSVGMRIRKAVPEGYKTHQTQSFTNTYESYSVPTPSTAYVPSYSRPRELEPLCDIHSVGGLRSQESLVDRLSGYRAVNDTLNAYGVNGYVPSQQSDASVQSIDSPMGTGGPVGGIANSRRSKRGYDDDEDEVESLWVSRFESMSTVEGRYIAKPRSRRKVEQPVIPSMANIDFDFEEASFLAPLNGREVEMSEF